VDGSPLPCNQEQYCARTNGECRASVLISTAPGFRLKLDPSLDKLPIRLIFPPFADSAGFTFADAKSADVAEALIRLTNSPS
jgi:hypothetical protein